MANKKPSQLGVSAIWDGPYKSPESSLAKGNSRNNMKVSQADVPYKAGAITQLAK
tara:strand:+ start:543 stop:707 length:165 start_codon:yes stop_codon:yes gene_type:complete